MFAFLAHKLRLLESVFSIFADFLNIGSLNAHHFCKIMLYDYIIL